VSEFEHSASPLGFLSEKPGDVPGATALAAYQHWWSTEGRSASKACWQQTSSVRNSGPGGSVVLWTVWIAIGN